MAQHFQEIQYLENPQWKVAYQHMSEDGSQAIGLFDEDGKSIELPEKHEARVVTRDAFPKPRDESVEWRAPDWVKQKLQPPPVPNVPDEV